MPTDTTRETTAEAATPEPIRVDVCSAPETRGASQATTGADVERAIVRIMSYNILYGFDWGAVRDLIRANPVDVLCLQEVPQAGYPKREAVSPQQILSDFDWPHDCAMLWHRKPRSVGNMTLVREGEIRPGEVLCADHLWSYGLLNEVEVHGTRLIVANVHLSPVFWFPALSFTPTEVFRWREARHLTWRCQDFSGPVIALGDFNSFWPAPACLHMTRHWRECRREDGGDHPPTRPTYGLPFVIDHIYTRGDVETVDYQVVDGPGSDHCAIIATLSVPVIAEYDTGS